VHEPHREELTRPDATISPTFHDREVLLSKSRAYRDYHPAALLQLL
jgi:hypothetical protein